ncbi:hypothetical protein GTP23_06970 [Pseudoduganella sp. FT93W]|uniref:Uncharacterized protein n=1 Tax=Duganella fentianensis TaxID=2692177 RepID=A0A845HZ41_9BURK|nr:hypothetical protein [Duganella fentianensis]MYN44815.1 hypothetical protein [Duganella fentianensis]
MKQAGWRTYIQRKGSATKGISQVQKKRNRHLLAQLAPNRAALLCSKLSRKALSDMTLLFAALPCASDQRKGLLVCANLMNGQLRLKSSKMHGVDCME